jgi:hypothetical protein
MHLTHNGANAAGMQKEPGSAGIRDCGHLPRAPGEAPSLLPQYDQEDERETAIATISLETLAELTRIAPSRVTFFMNKIQELGIYS